MKRITLTLWMLLMPTVLFGQNFILDDGIVKCEGVEIGATGTIFGEVYEAVDRNLLIQRRDEGADLTKVCVSNVTDMSGMFQNSDFNQPIGNWDVSNVTDMGSMFQSSQFNQPIGSWNVSSVTDMSWMFQASDNFNQDLSNWDVSSVTNMSWMFYFSQFNQPIENWDVSNVTNMSRMFDNSPFNQPIGDWDVSNVTNMFWMFGDSPFNQPIGNWDVSSVTDMSLMFYVSSFNQPIGNWDVSNVTNMNSMFQSSSFNQPINEWCVSQIPSEPDEFSTGSLLTEENKPVWGTCSILDVSTPSVPIQLSPQNNSIDVSPTPELTWTTDSLSTIYQLQVFRGFDPIVIDTLITDSLFTISNPLIRLIDYYWRVRGVNENAILGGEFVKSEWSPVWKFTTDATGINPPIFIDTDGIVKCKGEEIGLTWLINGGSFEVVDRNLLIQRRNEGADLTKVCVSNVTDMSEMFQNSDFNQPIGNWDVSNVTDMSGMFSNSFSFNQPIGNWDVSNVTNMGGMFSESFSFNQPIGNWDVSSVTDMSSMFNGSGSYHDSNPFNQEIGNWDVSNVTNMGGMFTNSQFNQPIGNWDVSNVTNMSLMFGSYALGDYHNNFNQPIGDWDVSKVTSMGGMFWGSSFNQPIGDWDVSNVISMYGMFIDSGFNQPIGNWDVSNVTSMGSMFFMSGFNQSIGNWDVSNVTNMSGMFSENFSFNQPIGNWDVSNVTNMSEMFFFSFSFNQPIGNWDVSNVTDMGWMFRSSPFNQPIDEWCVTNIPFEPDQFSQNSPLTEENKPIWGTCPATNSQTFDASWNLVSVPVEMEDYSYSTLFPNSTEGTLYSFGDGYILEETLTPLKGYWINLTEGDSTTFSGERLFPTTLTLQSEWNLIGSVSEQTSLSDPNEIIIPGTLYGYNSGYFPAETIESGRGYWVNTLSDGEVELVRYDPADADATPTLFLQPLRSPSVLSEFDEIQFFIGDELLSQLYFHGEFGVDIHPLQTKLPPIPPKGSFDVRTTEGSWITEESQIRIRIQQTGSPVDMVMNGEHLYEIQFLNETLQPIGASVVVDGSAGAGGSSGSETSHSSDASGASISSASIAVPASAHWMDIQLHELEDPTEIPSQFSLAQNYPNPFNPSTRIEFSLPASVPVKLSVYTVTGQLVSTLINEPLSAGTHSVTFDGSSYPSGVYLYRLQTPSFTQSKLMNLIK